MIPTFRILCLLLLLAMGFGAPHARAQNPPPIEVNLGEANFGGPFFGNGFGYSTTNPLMNDPTTILTVSVTAPEPPYFLVGNGAGFNGPGTYSIKRGETLTVGAEFRPPNSFGRTPRVKFTGSFTVTSDPGKPFARTTTFNLTGFGIRRSIAQPFPDGKVTEHEWSAAYTFNGTDGLVFSDVQFQTRYMAKRMSIPYYSLQTNIFSTGRAELTGVSNANRARSRLVGFRRETDAQKTVVEAEYAIDRIPETSGASLLITQRYEFYRLDRDEQVEPSQNSPYFLNLFLGPQLQAARFKPIVKYEYFSELEDRLLFIRIPQRLHFQVDGVARNSVLAIKDDDFWSPISPGAYSLWNGHNPYPVEDSTFGIVRGKAGSIDNWHQSWEFEPEEPAPPPGCPECVHIHWRWGQFLNFPDRTVGNLPAEPIIRAGSQQDVEIGLTRYHEGEEDPEDWKALLNGEPAADEDIVFWYQGLNIFNQTDEFFLHGGYFAPAIQVQRRTFIARNRFDILSNWDFVEPVTLTNIAPKSLRVRLTLNGLSPETELVRATYSIGGVALPVDNTNPRAPVIDITPAASRMPGIHSLDVNLFFRQSPRPTFVVPWPKKYSYTPLVHVEVAP